MATLKLSTKGRYGLYAMLELAANSATEPLPSKTIAKAQGISEAYLEQLFVLLRKAGLVTATRGAQGGYTVSRPPQEITVGDVLRALEGNLWHVDCMDDPCDNAGACPSHTLFVRIQKSIESVVDETSLQDMLDGRVEKENDCRQCRQHSKSCGG